MRLTRSRKTCGFTGKMPVPHWVGIFFQRAAKPTCPSPCTASAPRGLAVAVFLLLASTCGCATTMTQAELKFLETREIDLPYNESYDAALNAMFSLGLQITHSDKTSGVISGQSGDYVLRANMSRSKRRRHPVKKVSLLVSDRGPRLSQLRMKVLANEKQQVDRKLMTSLWQRIEREAMLDTRPVQDAKHRRRR